MTRFIVPWTILLLCLSWQSSGWAEGDLSALPSRHPVLGVSPERVKPHPLSWEERNKRIFKKELAPQAYRSLVSMKISSDPSAWSKAYGHAEYDAAELLCRRVNGRSRDEVKQLIGSPRFHSPSPLCDDKSKLENWLYFVGGQPMLMRLYFHGATCNEARCTTFDRDSIYSNWQRDAFFKFAVGKSRAEIIAKAGPPFEKDKWFRLGIGETELKQERLLTDSAEETLYYNFGDSRFMSVARLRNGRCFEVADSVAIGTQGLRYWEYAKGNARFQNPFP